MGVLFAPGSWCPGCTPDQGRHPLVCAKSRAQTRDPSPPSLSANLRRSRITKRHQGFTHVHPSGLSLACGSPLGVVRSWASPSLLHTPPLPATHGEVGTGSGHLPESSLSSALLTRSDLVSHRFSPFRAVAPTCPGGGAVRLIRRRGCAEGRWHRILAALVAWDGRRPCGEYFRWQRFGKAPAHASLSILDGRRQRRSTASRKPSPISTMPVTRSKTRRTRAPARLRLVRLTT